MEFTDIIGVQELFENDDNIDKLLHYVITKGRVFPGYKGTYLYNNGRLYNQLEQKIK